MEEYGMTTWVGERSLQHSASKVKTIDALEDLEEIELQQDPFIRH